MGKSENGRVNGPDWTDIRGYMSEIKKVYQVECVVTIGTLTVAKNTEIRVGVAASWPDLEKPGKVQFATVFASFPTPDGVSMDALVYRLLHKLDYELTDERFYQTEIFPRA